MFIRVNLFIDLDHVMALSRIETGSDVVNN
jgi:hypothetical protein